MEDKRLRKIKKILLKKREFSDLSAWTFEEIKLGVTSPIKFRLSLGSTKYFLKLVKDNEKDILKILGSMNSELIPRIMYPDLLDQNILVCEYIDGGYIKNHNLNPGLIRNYTRMQNLLNDDLFIKQNKFFNGYIKTEFDNEGFRNYVLDSIPIGYNNLINLRGIGLDIIEDYLEIFDALKKKSNVIANEYSQMPFARLHHDFRRVHITKSPQKLVDWCSSYGHGPFLFDLAPFLWGDPKSLRIFIESSQICRNSNEEQIKRWLFISNCFRFILFLRYVPLQIESEYSFSLILKSKFVKNDIKFKNFVEEFFLYHFEPYENLHKQQN